MPLSHALLGSPEAFDIRVRPALDSPGAALDRIKMVGGPLPLLVQLLPQPPCIWLRHVVPKGTSRLMVHQTCQHTLHTRLCPLACAVHL